MSKLERNLTQIYRDTYFELLNALPPEEQVLVIKAKDSPASSCEVTEVFIARVCDKAEAAYDKQFAPTGSAPDLK